MMNSTKRALAVFLLCITLTEASASESGQNHTDAYTQLRRRLSNPQVSFPTQTFFVPFPEEDMFKEMFYQINPEKARPGIVTMLSIAVSTDNTVLWYDHHEDGYEESIVTPTSVSTMVWGDRNAANGCAPDVDPCTDENDKLMAGDVVVVQNTVELPRNPSQIFYDGGDRIQVSYPIAITRGAYPVQPGSLMAGAVEVLDLENWGNAYEAPLGMDLGKYFQAFQYSAFFFMAAFDDTLVTLPDGSKVTLMRGQGSMVRINQRDQLVSDKPIQVDLITGDVWSYYELRWYSFISNRDWHNSYVSSVGDTVGKTKVLLYNPHAEKITVSVDYLEDGETWKTVRTAVSSRRAVMSNIIPTGSGAFFNSTKTFMALSLTDTEFTASTGQKTGSQWYDWGFPVMPRSLLTAQVLIGWGYGCTNNKCYGQEDRSVVWVTPIHDADIFVDYNNIGENYLQLEVDALKSVKITDHGDDDMSGAVIFATQKGSGADGPPVDIAAAWGQDPSVSKAYQSISLDLGTVVLPFSQVRVTKFVDKEYVKPGETLTYTIRVANVGNKKLRANTMKLFDQVDEHATYVEGSTRSGLTESMEATPDDMQGETRFPLDEDGVLIPEDIERRGGAYDFTFTVIVDFYEHLEKPVIMNAGQLHTIGGAIRPFQAISMVNFEASITITNTVYIGRDNGQSCGTTRAVEKVQGNIGDEVTFCLKVTNNGKSQLGDVLVRDIVLDYEHPKISKLVPGESKMIHVHREIRHSETNIAVAVGNPTFHDGTDIPTLRDVTASDPSAVEKIDYSPNIQIENTVYLGADQGAQCETDLPTELAVGILGDDVVYCFAVTNIGDTYLNEVKLHDPELSFTDLYSIGLLAPGETVVVPYQTTISGNLVNYADVVGNPVTEDEKDLIGVDDVRDSDPSEVQARQPNPQIEIINKVYLGEDAGDFCGTDKAVEKVGGFKNQKVVYCFTINNPGDTYLSDVVVDNVELDFTDDSSLGVLAPGASTILSLVKTIDQDLVNYASVQANPVHSDGSDMVGFENVFDSDPSAVEEHHDMDISVENLVYLGHDDGIACGTNKAVEFETGFKGQDVTYCFEVTNTGIFPLIDVQLVNTELSFTDDSISYLEPGQSVMIHFQDEITGHLKNFANVTGTPATPEGEAIDGADPPRDSDPSEVEELDHAAGVRVENTVYLGEDEGGKCETDLPTEVVEGLVTSSVVYCFKIINYGNTHLSNVRLENPELSFSDSSTIETLAPGEVAYVWHQTPITGSLTNSAKVTATPVTETGEAIDGADPVEHTDPSAVVSTALHPKIVVDNKVYAGQHDDGASCNTRIPRNQVTGYNGAPVTYCFNITNTGNSCVTNVKIKNKKLKYEDDTIGMLAPGETIYVPYPDKITGDLRNNVVVTATPSLCSGEPIPGVSKVEDEDASIVKALAINPKVEITNKVYKGHNNGESCGGDIPKEEYKGHAGDEITFCFVVTNHGDTYLGCVMLENSELAFVDSSIGLLAPGASAVIPFQTKLTSTHQNKAVVTACPSTAKGDEIKNAHDVSAHDNSKVIRIDYKASIEIQNTVYRGHDSGDSCGSDAAVEKVHGFRGAKVTYCFLVTNTGQTFLGDISIDNPDLDVYLTSDVIGNLAPGNSTMISVNKYIDGDLENNAKVRANPISPEGNDLPYVEEVSSTDPSSVGLYDNSPSIEIENTVYLGNDGGEHCGTSKAVEKVTSYSGDYVVYCFLVTNTGNTHLSSVTVHNGHLSFTDLSVGMLAPGDTALVVSPGVISGDLRNLVQVAANPVSPQGEDIVGAPDVTDTDPSEVARKDANPSITVENTVYLGDDNGDSCGTELPKEKVQGYHSDSVVYCFVITNTGDVPLDNVILKNVDLDFIDTDSIGILQPLDSITVPLPATIDADLVNTVEVTAVPVTDDGIEITGIDEKVEDSDDSEVEKLEHDATIMIENNVYLGHDNGESCGTDAASSRAAGYEGADVTFCFLVTNTGSTHLADVVLDDKELSFFDDTSIGTLAPGESKMLYFEDSIGEDVKNIAIATANPVSPEGVDLPGTDDPEDKDPSEITKLVHEASISIDNTVYSGHDNGEMCDTEIPVEKLVGFQDETITYCLKIINNGNTHLNQLIVDDPELSFRDTTRLGILAPGAAVILPVKRLLKRNFTNTASVIGKPASSDGSLIENLPQVTDEDPSEVAKKQANPGVEIQNEVYLGDDDGDSCDTDKPVEQVDGYAGDKLVFCFTVTNTGDVPLDKVIITNGSLDVYDDSIDALNPGETVTVAVPSTVVDSMTNIAVVSATPVTDSGKDIPGISDTPVSDQDPSSVVKLARNASIQIENTVYLGNDGGDGCVGDKPREKVVDFSGSPVTYCFTVKNIGETYLNNVTITNHLLSFTDHSIPMLPPGASDIVSLAGIIEGDLQNTADVRANPVSSKGDRFEEMDPVTDSDPSAVQELSHSASISIDNVVYHGHDGGQSCASGIEQLTGFAGEGITYCLVVTNTGNTYLDRVKVDDTEISFLDTSTITMLAPGDSVTLYVPRTLDYSVENTANVQAMPVTPEGNLIDLEEVRDSDPSSVVLTTIADAQPSIKIENTVYLGHDYGGRCSTAGERATGEKDDDVVFCYKVTNNGETFLTNILISTNVSEVPDNSIGKLRPGEFEVVPFAYKIDGNITNMAVVTANPVMADLSDIPLLDDVSDSDPSGVLEVEKKSGPKDPYKPPTEPQKCMQNNYDDAGNDGELICAAKEVFLEEVTSDVTSCVEGQMFNATIEASIRLVSARYDVGWYIATDGGDSLDGTCVINGFQENNTYMVVESAGSTDEIGYVAWQSDLNSTVDDCGDVFTAGGGSNVDTPILVNVPITCTDENDDGNMDFSICFTWRTEETDGLCQLEDGLSVIPGETEACFCTRYDVPTITVVEPNDDEITPCR